MARTKGVARLSCPSFAYVPDASADASIAPFDMANPEVMKPMVGRAAAAIPSEDRCHGIDERLDWTVEPELPDVDANSVFVLNLFLGWTSVGWVVALAMAVAGGWGLNFLLDPGSRVRACASSR